MYLISTLQALLILSVVCKVYSLKCYECDSAYEPDCKEKFDWDHVNELNVQPVDCHVDSAKYCIKTTGIWGAYVGTRRFCSSRDMFTNCFYITYGDHNRMYRSCIYTCQGDGCNSSHLAQANLSIICHLLVIVGLVYKMKV